MQNRTKIFLAVAIAALIVVIGIIVLGGHQPEVAPEATAAPEVTQVPEATPAPEAAQEPEPTQGSEEQTPEEEIPESELYEGVLAGLTEEEIGALAMAEEHVSIDELGEDGVD